MPVDDIIGKILEDSLSVKRQTIDHYRKRIIEAADRLAECIVAGNKILIFGNGGSAADSQHIAAELVNRFKIERPPLAAIALTTDTSILTSVGNDYDFEQLFAKQVAALGRQGDIAWGISTSGNSPNVVAAINKARQMGLYTLAMTGRGGKMAGIADLVLPVDSDDTPRIQETQITVAHILCDLVDRILFPDQFEQNGT
jgi:D-sedoheptulose 7-phosphate isomerase